MSLQPSKVGGSLVRSGEKEGRGAGWKEGTLHQGWPQGWPRRAKGPQTGANTCPGCLDVREGPIDASPTLFKL